MLDKNKNNELNELLLGVCERGDIEAARSHIEAGADVNARDWDGKTPLHFACKYGFTGLVRLLLERGADVNARDREDTTPLYYAYEKNDATLPHRDHSRPEDHLDIARALIAAGADVNTRDVYGGTPLHDACFDGNPVAVRLLLENGADVNAKDDTYGDTPLDWALQHARGGKREILDAFREHHPESTLQTVLNLPPEDPMRERMLDRYREHHPELVMEAWCTSGG